MVFLFWENAPHCEITTGTIRINLFPKGIFMFHHMLVLASLLLTRACVEITGVQMNTGYDSIQKWDTTALCSWVELTCDCSASFQSPMLSSFCLFSKLSFSWKLSLLCVPCVISVLPLLEGWIKLVSLGSCCAFRLSLIFYFGAEFLPTPLQIYTPYTSSAFCL